MSVCYDYHSSAKIAPSWFHAAFKCFSAHILCKLRKMYVFFTNCHIVFIYLFYCYSQKNDTIWWRLANASIIT